MRYRSDMGVRLIRSMGDDLAIIDDARTSLRAPEDHRPPPQNLKDRHRDLLREFFRLGHASTLRGCVITVELEVPLFVQRELRTHWVGNHQLWDGDILGWNDQSGRYRKYEPVFWVPNRPFMEPEGFNPMTPQFVEGTQERRDEALLALMDGYEQLWQVYEGLIEHGIAREVARSVLPQGIYVAGRMTLNANAAFRMMSLRINHPDNARPTYPQREIQEVAMRLEELVREWLPETHAAWVETGRVSP